MKSTASLVALAAAATALTLAPTVTGKEQFVTRIPNGANVPGVKALGHSDTTGASSTRNVFGKAFEKAGSKWTAALCAGDADGDGQTNGQELGDPCCEWKEGATPRYTTGVSHPGDANKKADATLWASISCPPAPATDGSSPAPAQATSPLVLMVGLGAGVVAGVAALGFM